MSFLFPTLLFLGILAVVPFIIHLFGERNYRPLPFSSLKFLREIERESMQRLQWRRWLILLSRAMWILMLILILANPFLNKATGSLDDGFLIIDKSFSTSIDPDYQEMLGELNESFHSWEMIEYDEKTSTDSLMSKIDKLKHNYRVRRNIIWVSDLQKNRQNENIFLQLKKYDDALFVLSSQKKQQNSAVLKLEKKTSDIKGSQKIALHFDSNSDSDNFTADIFVNSKRIGKAYADENNFADYLFDHESIDDILCLVESPDDAYPEDNKRFLVIANYKKIRVLCVNQATSGYYHLNALRAMDEVDLSEINPIELPAYDLNDYDIVWFSALYGINAATIEKLKKYREDHILILGASMEFIENDPGHPDNNSSWKTLCSSIHLPVSANGFLALENEKRERIHDMRIKKYFESNAQADNIIWQASDGAPILFEDKKNTYLLMSPFLFDWNEMGLSPYYIQVLRQFIDAGLQKKTLNYETGDIIQLEEGFTRVTRPGGEVFNVRDEFTHTEEAGFYKLERGGETKIIAVNIPSEECIQSIIEVDPELLLSYNSEDPGSIESQIRGRNAQTLFFVLALLFIILEMMLIRRGESTE